MKTKLNCVMVIDDDEPTNYFNKLIVEESGCTNQVMVAQSGQEALDYLAHNTEQGIEENKYPCPKLIFLDINMPAMNGWEFMDRYKMLSKERKAEIVIVMLTTSLCPEDIIKAMEIPEISAFEHKPLTHEKLERVLGKYFPVAASILN